MKNTQNQNARRKRLLRQLLRLAGLAVLAAVVIFLAIRVVDALRNHGQQTGDGSVSTSETGDSSGPIDYESIVYRNGTATLRFLRQEGEWVWQDDPDFPLIQADVDAVAAAIADLPVRQTVEDAADLSEYELDDPNYEITVTWTDGSENHYALGKATTNGDGRYLLRGDEDTVYIITDNLTALLDKPVYSMMRLPEAVSLEESQLTAVTYTAGETELRLVASQSGGSVTWKYGNEDVTASVRDAMAVLCNWQVESCVDYDPSHDAAVLCGFGSPTAKIEISYLDTAGAEQTLVYTIGAAAPDGSGRCLRIGEERTVFAVTAESADAVLALRDLAA